MDRHVQGIILLGCIGAVFATNAVTAAATANIDLSISPREPLTLEDTTVEVQINSSQERSYLLSLDVLYRDRTIKQQQYRFELGAGRRTGFQIPVTPTNIGNYTVAATLLDKKGQTVYASATSDFNVVSDVGPFDLFLNTPAQYIPPDIQIPIIVRAKNVGVSGVDTEINITSRCFEGKNRVKRFFVYVNSSGSAIDQGQIASCNEPGAHTITASLSVYGEQQVSATTQYIEREGMQRPEIGVPDDITVRGEQSKNSILIRNTADTPIKNLQPYVFGVPPEWVQLTPHQITEIPPNESATFVATITPKAPEKRQHDILIGVSGPDAFAQKPATLNIRDIEIGTGPEPPGDEQPLIPPDIKDYLMQLLAVIAGVVVILLATGAVQWLRDEWKHRNAMEERLERVKDGFRTAEPRSSGGQPMEPATKQVRTVDADERRERGGARPERTERAEPRGEQGRRKPGMDEAERRFQQVLDEAEAYTKRELGDENTYAYEQRLQRLRERARSAETVDELLQLLDRADRIFEQLQDRAER